MVLRRIVLVTLLGLVLGLVLVCTGCGSRRAYVDYQPPPEATPFEQVADGVVLERGYTIPGSGETRLREGPYTRYHADGTLAEEGFYLAGRRQGAWYVYDRRGRLSGKRIYRDGELLRDIRSAPQHYYYSSYHAWPEYHYWPHFHHGYWRHSYHHHYGHHPRLRVGIGIHSYHH